MTSDRNAPFLAPTAASGRSGSHGCTVVVVLPVHNEADSIRSVTEEILAAIAAAGHAPTLLLVDDGSTDGTLDVIRGLASRHACVEYLSFSRNFGKEAAIMAGLREAGDDFDILAYMDSDGQHDPADLVAMIEVMIRDDVQMVCGARVDRSYQSGRQRWLAKNFYRLFHKLSKHRIEEGVGDFNVLRPAVVRTLRELKEEHIFMKGLIAWVGYSRINHPITIRPRAGGMAKSSTRKMASLALGAFLSFSSWPLRVWSLVGFVSALLALVYLAIVVLQTIIAGREVPGYATTIVLILGLGGIQLFSVGILGEYIARIYDASKDRPRYVIAERGGGQQAAGGDALGQVRTG